MAEAEPVSSGSRAPSYAAEFSISRFPIPAPVHQWSRNRSAEPVLPASAREREDIWQFVMRGATRMADFQGTYPVYLYSLWQAEALSRMLGEEGISENVSVEAVGAAGILYVARPKPGPKPGTKAAASDKSFEEREAERRATDRERKQRHRERERAEREAAGTLRSRGRPRKSDGAEASP